MEGRGGEGMEGGRRGEVEEGAGGGTGEQNWERKILRVKGGGRQGGGMGVLREREERHTPFPSHPNRTEPHHPHSTITPPPPAGPWTLHKTKIHAHDPLVANNLMLSKIEKVPRGIRGEKSSKDMASSRNLVSTIGALASPKMGDGTRCPEG